MTKKRSQYNNQFMFKVAVEAVKELRTINEIASAHGVHPSQVKTWRKQLLPEGPTVFSSHASQQQQRQGAQEAKLYEQIGRLKPVLSLPKRWSLSG